MPDWIAGVLAIALGVAGFGIYALGYHNGVKSQELSIKYLQMLVTKGFHFSDLDKQSEVYK